MSTNRLVVHAWTCNVHAGARWRRTLVAIAFLGLVSRSAVGAPKDASALARRSFYAAADAAPIANNPVIAAPKVNQIGYLPSAGKTFHVTLGSPAQPGDAFSVLSSTEQAVMTGTLATSAFDDTDSTGESVLTGDFSALAAPGQYAVSVDGTQSPSFTIGGDIYAPLFRDAMRAFYIIRCGVAIDDPETGIQHPACHTADAVLRTDPSQSVDVTGGWHNAGDFGKRTPMAAISASYMMWLYELNAMWIGDVNTDIPESGNGTPDILNEARWGITWLLKMQQADGSVLHKVDTEPNFAWGLSPDKDPYQRSTGLASTIDAADFAAVMAQASRVFASLDSAFATKCLAAANSAWKWVSANPNIGETDIYYTDPDPSQEVLWALAEMVRATHDPTLTQTFDAQVQATPLTAVTWQTPELLGYMSVAMDPQSDTATKGNVVSTIVDLDTSFQAATASTGYGVISGPSDYIWESNEYLLHDAAALIFGYELTGNDSYRRLALAQLDWLLGDNSLNQSFVTGYGSNPVVHPYHWTAYALGKLMPGWCSGGPNQYTSGADVPLQTLINEGTPPAKCYLDQGNQTGSWASNEGETTENAVLAFATGYFVRSGTDAGSAAGADSGGDGEADAAFSRTISSSGGCSCAVRGAGPTGFPGVLGTAALLALAPARRARSAAKRRPAGPLPR
jgi:endoglucanase